MRRNKSKIASRFILNIVVLSILAGTGLLLSWIWHNLVFVDKANDLVKAALFMMGIFASFTASVLANDQNDRLKNSAFGGLITTGLSALISIISKGDNAIDYLLFSTLGSVIGATIGWFLYAIVALDAYVKYQSPLPLIELITNGLGGIRDQIISSENIEPLRSLSDWWSQSSQDFKNKADFILTTPKNSKRDEITKQSIESFLSTVCVIHNLLYRTNQMRASIIKFDNQKENGLHWISAENIVNPFDLKPFDKASKAYALIHDTAGLTYMFIDTKKETTIQNRSSDRRYRYFSLFKIDQFHILTLDWPDDIVEENRIMIKGYFQTKIIGTFERLIKSL